MAAHIRRGWDDDEEDEDDLGDVVAYGAGEGAGIVTLRTSVHVREDEGGTGSGEAISFANALPPVQPDFQLRYM
jgi:hypothetical protein